MMIEIELTTTISTATFLMVPIDAVILFPVVVNYYMVRISLVVCFVNE